MFLNKLNTSPSFRDVKFLVYKEVWFYHVKQLKTELFSLLKWDDLEQGWREIKSGIYFFQYRKSMKFICIQHVFKKGKLVWCTHKSTSLLPPRYFYTYQNTFIPT
jgi:hypothetical protein